MRVALSDLEVDNLIKESRLLILLVGSSSCMPCKAIGNKIDEYLKENHNIDGRYLMIECFKEYLADMSILSVPTVLVYAEGKLQIKESGYFSLDRILAKLERLKKLIFE